VIVQKSARRSEQSSKGWNNLIPLIPVQDGGYGIEQRDNNIPVDGIEFADGEDLRKSTLLSAGSGIRP
jgi:hypothetical protein